MRAKRYKYHNTPTTVDGVRFASHGEARRWGELRLLEQAGKISHLKRQVVFKLRCNGVQVCSYVADFVYIENGREIVEDFKGVQTSLFKVKAKLFAANFGKTIRITGKSRR